MGADAHRWNTLQFERTVLVVARTLTSTVWGLDFLSEVLADPRIQIVFTVEDQSPSAFHRGASDLLEMVEAPVISWAQAASRRFDLAICSSHRGSLTQLDAPLLVGLHGAGIGKPSALPDPDVLRQTASGAVGEVPALTTAVAHPEQIPYFADPEAPRSQGSVDVQVVGDPLLDRLVASEAWREQYRSELGVRDDERLIVLSSTWGGSSLMSSFGDLAIRLTAELPTDRYRVAYVLHPNIWIGHGGWQVRAWLRREHAAGVLIVPPWRNAWRSCVVASDAVIHDHGSVGLYAAALGRPTLHVVHDTRDMLAGSAIAELTRLSPRLRLDRPLLPQVSGAIDEYRTGQYREATSRVSGAPGQALALHRDLIYRLLRLDPPPWPARVLAVDPCPERLPLVHSHQVVAGVRGDHTVRVNRYPAVTPPPPRRTIVWIASSGVGCIGTRYRAVSQRSRHHRGIPRAACPADARAFPQQRSRCRAVARTSGGGALAPRRVVHAATSGSQQGQRPCRRRLSALRLGDSGAIGGHGPAHEYPTRRIGADLAGAAFRRTAGYALLRRSWVRSASGWPICV